MFSRRRFLFLFRKDKGSEVGYEEGSMVLEGAVVFPMVLLLLFFFISLFNWFFVSSLIRQRLDSYGALVSGIGGVGADGSVTGLILEGGVEILGEGSLKKSILEGGFLDESRLKVVLDLDGGYMAARVEYLVDVVFMGRIRVVEFYERRLWW